MYAHNHADARPGWLELLVTEWAMGISAVLYAFSFFPVPWRLQAGYAYATGLPFGFLANRMLRMLVLLLAHGFAIWDRTLLTYVKSLLAGGHRAGAGAPRLQRGSPELAGIAAVLYPKRPAS